VADTGSPTTSRVRTSPLGAPRAGAIVLALVATAFVAGLVTGQATERADRVDDEPPATQRFRPAVHFTPSENWMNDPNGPVYADGRYHLYYQYNPFGNLWGNIGWGHAVSTDLIEWEERPMALAAAPPDMTFSGSAVVDRDNRSGLCDEPGCLVAIYTGLVVDPGTATSRQDQRIAVSNDGGETFRAFDGNPVLDLDLADFRDPNVFWHEPTGRWVLAVALPIERKILFYVSDNLIDWEPASEFGPAGVRDGLWECPVLLELPIAGTDKTRWVLKVDHNPGHITGGSGAQYFVGDFDGTAFVADDVDGPPRWVDYGADFYCAMTFSDEPDPQSGRTWIGWMSNWDYANAVPTHPWRGAMTLPRTVGLSERDGEVHLTQQPSTQLDSRRADHRRYEGSSIDEIVGAVAADPGGDVLDIVADIAVGDAARVGVDLAVGERTAVRIRYDVEADRLSIDRTQSGDATFAPGFAAVHDAPLEAIDGRISLRIVLDRSSIEVFADDGRVVLTDLIFPGDGATGVAVNSDGGPSGPASLDLWALRT
jgi:fructan beta-fructosidase